MQWNTKKNDAECLEECFTTAQTESDIELAIERMPRKKVSEHAQNVNINIILIWFCSLFGIHHKLSIIYLLNSFSFVLFISIIHSFSNDHFKFII